MRGSEKKIKVLYIVNASIPNERANGVQIANTCAGMGAQGVGVTLVSRKSREQSASVFSYYKIPQTFTHVELPTFDIPNFPFRYFFRNAFFLLSVQVYVLVALVHAFFTRQKLVVYVRGETVLSLVPLSYIVSVFFETHQIRNYERLYRIALERVTGIVVITEGLQKKFIEEYHIQSKKILVARDSVDLEKFKNVASDRNIWTMHAISNQKKIVLYSGTLAPEKGVDTLRNAAAHLSSDIHVVFLGGTELQVAEFTARHASVQNVSVLGRVDYTMVPKYLASADALVLPDSSQYTYSNLYTSPMKLFEYMASGRPIIASSVPSLREVLTEETAFFFEADNAASLAETIQNVLQNPAQSAEKAKKAEQTVAAFTWEKRTEAIVTHIHSCVRP